MDVQDSMLYELHGCILCLSDKSELIDIYGDLGQSFNINNILSKHFWIEISKFTVKKVCQGCWSKIFEFNEFYSEIEAIHKNFYWKSNENDLIQADDIKLEQPLFDFNLDHDQNIATLNEDDQDQCDDAANDFADIKDDCSTDSDDMPLVSKIVKERKSNSRRTQKNKKSLTSSSPEHVVKIKKEDEQIKEFGKMKCDICSEDMKSFHQIRQHYRREHQMRGYIECCGKKYTRRHRISEHILVHLNPHLFRCELCNKNYANQQSLYNHNISLHMPSESRPYKCEKCPRTFAKNYLLVAHQIKHMAEKDKKSVCCHCDKAFPTNYKLVQHTRQVHESANALMCDICSKVLKSKATFLLHRREHNETKKIQCTICGAWLKNQSTMRRHMKAHEQENGQFICDICGKQSPNREALLKHKNYLHLMERKHKCNLCDKAFKRALNLKEHMATHTGEVLYKCLYCEKTFNSSANMHSHKKKIHTKEWEETQKLKANNI